MCLFTALHYNIMLKMLKYNSWAIVLTNFNSHAHTVVGFDVHYNIMPRKFSRIVPQPLLVQWT